MKPGYKTTEFWMHLLVVILGAVMSVHVIPDTNPVAKLIALAVTVLTSLGYTVSRTIVKTSNDEASSDLSSALLDHVVPAVGQLLPTLAHAMNQTKPAPAPVADPVPALVAPAQGGFSTVVTMAGIAVVAALALFGCGPVSKQVVVDVGGCALNQLPGAITEVIPEVAAALRGNEADWAAEIVKLEARGADFAICAVKVAIADLMRLSSPELGAPALKKDQIAIHRAGLYLGSKGVK